MKIFYLCKNSEVQLKLFLMANTNSSISTRDQIIKNLSQNIQQLSHFTIIQSHFLDCFNLDFTNWERNKDLPGQKNNDMER